MKVDASSQDKSKAALLALFSVAVASAQDAIVKTMAGTYPAYETVMIRTITALPVLLILLMVFGGGLKALRTPLLGWIFLRGLVLCTAYFAFILSIAAMPIANAVAIYFTMPFFVAILAGRFLGERVPLHRWFAIAAAFIGVLIMVRPFGGGGGEHDLFAAACALYSAMGYAAGQMMGRALSQRVDPLVITNAQNLTYMVVAFVVFAFVSVTGIHLETNKSLAFLTRAFVWPTQHDFLLMAGMGMLSSVAAMSFTWAYKLGEASFVAPFEYSAMIWAVTFGLILFNDFPDRYTWIGMAIVVLAGLYLMEQDRKRRITVTTADNPTSP
jgi:drug/metabolite transporter (DMT)-like permease